MTIIDTTNYLNGTLRLSRHGRGRGGNILMHIGTKSLCEISDAGVDKLEEVIARDRRVHSDRSFAIFNYMKNFHPAG